MTEAAICSLPTVTASSQDVEDVRILGGAKETVGIEAGEGSTFAHFLTPWGMMLEFVSFPNGRNTLRTGTSCFSPVNPAA